MIYFQFDSRPDTEGQGEGGVVENAMFRVPHATHRCFFKQRFRRVYIYNQYMKVCMCECECVICGMGEEPPFDATSS